MKFILTIIAASYIFLLIQPNDDYDSIHKTNNDTAKKVANFCLSSYNNQSSTNLKFCNLTFAMNETLLPNSTINLLFNGSYPNGNCSTPFQGIYTPKNGMKNESCQVEMMMTTVPPTTTTKTTKKPRSKGKGILKKVLELLTSII